MIDPKTLNSPIDFDSMTQADFETYLPEFFASRSSGVSTDPRLQNFLAAHPDCAALVRDLETIAEHARSLFEQPAHEPSDNVWARIQNSLQEDPIIANVDPIIADVEAPSATKAGVHTGSGTLSRNGEPNQLVTGGSLHDIE